MVTNAGLSNATQHSSWTTSLTLLHWIAARCLLDTDACCKQSEVLLHHVCRLIKQLSRVSMSAFASVGCANAAQLHSGCSRHPRCATNRCTTPLAAAVGNPLLPQHTMVLALCTYTRPCQLLQVASAPLRCAIAMVNHAYRHAPASAWLLSQHRRAVLLLAFFFYFHYLAALLISPYKTTCTSLEESSKLQQKRQWCRRACCGGSSTC